MSCRARLTLPLALLALAACARTPTHHPAERALDPPAEPGALAPRLAPVGDDIALSWLEPSGEGHRLRMAVLDPSGPAWGPPETVASGDDWFANWADLPAVTRFPSGEWLAGWLAKLDTGTYAYGIHLARREANGWQPLGLLHSDASPVEHGFVSWLPTADGVMGFWLDGRAMEPEGAEGEGGGGHGAGSGTMQLRAARLGPGGTGPEAVLDDATCECCATAAAMAEAGPVVVYRDRSPGEVRDVAIVRATPDGWSEPRIVHEDGWVIPGCPVNGPAVAAVGDRVVVAWYTAADEHPRVQVAWSEDGGATFGAPVLVSRDRPLGRVGLALADGRAWVSWLEQTGEVEAEARVVAVAADGELGEPIVVAATSPRRSAGVPQLARHGDALVAVWVEEGARDGQPARLRGLLVPLSEAG